MKGLLCKPASELWSAVNALARAVSLRDPGKLVRFPGRTVSVGNIQAGGTGKTPLVALIAREGLSRGLTVAILCRGYRGVWEVSGGVLRPGGAPAEPRLCGDEAALLREQAPEAWIGVGADRIAQYGEIARALGRAPDLVILDDGFQNLRIRKDLEIVALTSASRSDAVYRDWASALVRADLVVWTKGAIRPDPKGRPMCRVRFRLPPGSDPVVLVTGVGDPASVRRSVEEAGHLVVDHVCFRDHAEYDFGRIKRMIEAASSKGCRTATTGKDWVKWKEAGIPPGNVIVLEPEPVFEEGRDLWEKSLWG